MDGHEDSVTCMVIDQNILITGSDDMTIRLWNLESFSYSGLVGTKEQGHKEAIQDLCFLEKSGLLLSCSYDK